MDEAMVKAWDDYIQDGGDRAVHPMFAEAFSAGWNAAIAEYENEAENQRKRDECIGRYGA